MAATKRKKITKEQIVSKYMDYVLEEERLPVSVFKFCKNIKISEAEFYAHFGNFEAIQSSIWITFFQHTLTLIEKSQEYSRYDNRGKLLAFYYTFFELLTANRSYVLFALDQKGDLSGKIRQLAPLSKLFKGYLAKENMVSEDVNKKLQIPTAAMEELGWGQFLVILRFWIKDQSPGFEKTDVMIEKFVNTAYDISDYKPLESIVDFAKFIINEKAIL